MSDKLFVRVDDEDFSLRTPFVDVKELSNVPQVKVPSTAQEYLVSVIAERQNIDEVTQCDVDYKKFRSNQSLFYDQEPLPQISDKLKPTKEWQNIQIADFSDVRCYISRMRNQTDVMKKIRKFNFKKDANLARWQYVFNKYDPNLSIVLGFTATQIDKGLENLIKLIKQTRPGNTIQQQLGRWVYALLSCLKTPLHSDTVNIIRNLSKQCWTIRSLIDPECENVVQLAAPLTLIICLVGHYYRQLDLADSLERS